MTMETTSKVPAKEPVLRIEKCQSIDAIESHFKQLQDAKQTKHLAIPTFTRDAQLGAVGSLIQLIITWAKRYPRNCLVLHNSEDSLLPNAVNNLATSQHGLVALLGSSGVLTSDLITSADILASAEALRVLRLMSESKYGFSNGPELLLLSADDTTLAFMPQMYSASSPVHGKVRSYEDFIDLAGVLTDRLTTLYRDTVSVSLPLKENLATLLYELFKNTHMWARHDADNRPVSQSVRGIRLEYTRHESLRPETLSQWHRRYIAKLTADKRVDILELAVFDSGPGLAIRMYENPKDEVSLGVEYDAVLKCLELHRTSSRKSHHGIGLMEVMRALSRAKGFMRLRTGRLALFRDFYDAPLQDTDDLNLGDWTTGSSELMDHGSCEGLLVSILLPIERMEAKK